MATQSIDAYKKALELDPGSSVIRERLAEIYAKSQHIREAVAEAQQVLKIDPNNVDAHRLLARIYVRTLGDMNAGDVQQENLDKAVEQFQAILKLQPDDTYSALWLARLYRFENQHDDAEKVLRGILQHDPDNGQALEQLSQLLVDEGRSQEAIDLLHKPRLILLLPTSTICWATPIRSRRITRRPRRLPQSRRGRSRRSGPSPRAWRRRCFRRTSMRKRSSSTRSFRELEPGTAENYLRMAQLYRDWASSIEAQASL